MPEEHLALAWDPPSSRDATVSEWRIYLWHLAWQRGRHGRGGCRRGVTPLEVCRSIARISAARRRCQRPRGRGQRITQVPLPKEGDVNEGLAVDHPAGDDDQEQGEGEAGAEEPVAGKTCAEIDLAKAGAEEPVAGKTCAEIDLAKEPVTDEITAKESRQAEGGLEMVGKTEAEIALAKRWLPLRYPAFPTTGSTEDFVRYTNESERIRKLNKPGFDLCKKLPYWERKPDKKTSAAAKSSKERDICQNAGESVAAVSSVGPGQDSTALYCSGVIIDWPDGRLGWVRVLTSSGILYDKYGKLHSPDQKVYVKLANDQKYEGKVLFVNKHYYIALLEVCVGSSMVALSFSSMPRYFQRVTALGRDNMDIFLRDGFISTKERTSSGRTHYMILESANDIPVICAGGPAIDEDGGMVGIISCFIPEAAMTSISIVQICLDMWKNYSCIARPEINMDLSTVQNLPFEIRDKMQCIYKRRKGFIIDGVQYDSAPEKVGIRKGDIVEILDENCGPTLPELETYLLSHALRYLCSMEGLPLTKELELKVRVYDLLEDTSTDARVSLPFVCE